MATKKPVTSGLRKLLEDQLADTYFAEKQLLKALPKMAKVATNKELRGAFKEHLQETNGQLERLEQAFEAMDLPAKGKTCPAILGILQEATELMDEFADDPALDAALVSAAQKVEHYEIASYACLVEWSTRLELNDVTDLLRETLEEEQAASDKLMELSEAVSEMALTEEEGSEEEELEEVEKSGNGSAKGRSGSTKRAAAPLPVSRKR